MKIVVRCGNRPVPNAEVLLPTPDEIGELYQTDSSGKVILKRDESRSLSEAMLRIADSFNSRREAFVAAYGYQAFRQSGPIEIYGDRDLIIELKPIESSGGGSCIFRERSGTIPGLTGKLIVDRYGDKIDVITEGLAINGKNPPSTQIKYGETITITDIDRKTVSAAIRSIIGKSVLLDWWWNEDQSSRSENMDKPKMRKVFISHVSQNAGYFGGLKQGLELCGIEVWDPEKIVPGTLWKEEIREAIRGGDFFIACFSSEYRNRDSTHMNEELNIAIDELRSQPTNRAWFIPVKLNECKIPDRDIGGGRRLSDLQFVDLNKDWNAGVKRIAETILGNPIA